MHISTLALAASAVAYSAPDLGTPGAEAVSLAPLGTEAAASAPRSNVAAPKRAKPARKLSGAATGKPKPGKAASAKPASKPTGKPAADHVRHGSSTYRGASPVFRGHDRKLSPIVLDRIPGSYTDRDHAALKALYGKNGAKAFQRGDGDAGVFSRLIGHGALKHVGGSLDMHTATFAVTAAAIRERL